MKPAESNIVIRECTTLDELAECVALQREVFALPEIEISPVRHFIVTRNAGGFTLGAFADDQLIGFVLSVPAYLRGERAFYSHMSLLRLLSDVRTLLNLRQTRLTIRCEKRHWKGLEFSTLGSIRNFGNWQWELTETVNICVIFLVQTSRMRIR